MSVNMIAASLRFSAGLLIASLLYQRQSAHSQTSLCLRGCSYFSGSWQSHFLAEGGETRVVFVAQKKRVIIQSADAVLAVGPRGIEPREHPICVSTQGIDSGDIIRIGVGVTIDQRLERADAARAGSLPI